nr:metallophosphoesterase [uncultured Oscillibacter sp.]
MSQAQSPSSPLESTPIDPLTIVIASDPHYLAPALTDHGPYFQRVIEAADGKVTEYCEELLNAFTDEIIAQAPDVLILTGDLTFNGENQSHERLAEKLRQIEAAGTQVFVLPGNHDLENPMAAAFSGNGYTLTESLSGEEFSTIYRDFGFQNAIARDSASLSYVTELVPNLRLLAVDVNTEAAPGAVTEETLAWAERQLQSAKREGARVLAASHQNLLQHSSLFSDGYVMENSARLLELYEQYGVICNLSGHLHIQHTAQSEQGLWEIAASSLAVSPCQYGVLTLAGTEAEYHTKSLNVSIWAEKCGSTNPDLLAFSDYAETFFRDTSYRQAMAELADEPKAEAMAEFFAEVNTAYFRGRMDALAWDTNLYEAWQNRPSFLSVYLHSIAADPLQDHTTLSFHF